MELTKEQLVNLREQALVKRQGYLDMIHQADGALSVINLPLEQLNKSPAENSDG